MTLYTAELPDGALVENTCQPFDQEEDRRAAFSTGNQCGEQRK